jgi:hypothetical protein
MMPFCYFRLNSGKKDLQKLEDNQRQYVVITTWITTIEKRLQELKDDTSSDDEALKKRRVIILVRKIKNNKFSALKYQILFYRQYSILASRLDKCSYVNINIISTGMARGYTNINPMILILIDIFI